MYVKNAQFSEHESFVKLFKTIAKCAVLYIHRYVCIYKTMYIKDNISGAQPARSNSVHASLIMCLDLCDYILVMVCVHVTLRMGL